jgi:DNA-binding NarL/FixJ family response regulator
VLFTEDRDNATIQAALKAGVSAYIVAGMQPDRLQPILDVAVARFEQDRALRAELRDTQDKLAERKLIERAKGLVMKQKNVDEDGGVPRDAQACNGSQPQAARDRAADHRRLGAHELMRFGASAPRIARARCATPCGEIA